MMETELFSSKRVGALSCRELENWATQRVLTREAVDKHLELL